MLVGASFWSVVTLNLAFLLIIMDCWTKRLQWWFVIVPLIWFGGYCIAAAISHQQSHAFAEMVFADNTTQKTEFLPGEEDLLIESSARYVVSDERLIGDYDLPVVFQPISGQCGPYASIRIQSSGCEDLRVKAKQIRETGSKCPPVPLGVWENSAETKSVSMLKNLCRVSRSEPPVLPLVRIQAEAEQPIEGGLLSGKTRIVRIVRDDKESIVLKTGFVRPLPWFPTPVLGCSLNSSRPSWECVAFFDRPDFITLGVQSDTTNYYATDTVAAALGLRKAPASERFPQPTK